MLRQRRRWQERFLLCIRMFKVVVQPLALVLMLVLGVVRLLLLRLRLLRLWLWLSLRLLLLLLLLLLAAMALLCRPLLLLLAACQGVALFLELVHEHQRILQCLLLG